MSADECYGVSHRSAQHAVNDDALWLDREAGLYAVADGMGGQPGGDVASRLAVEMLGTAADLHGQETRPAKAWEARLYCALMAAHRRIQQAAEADRHLKGMGSTLSAVLVRGPRAFLAHVGDSRIYLFRAGSLRQLTNDHTLVAELVSGGHIRAEAAGRHPLRRMLTQVLGQQELWEPQIESLAVRPGDIFILATDGLAEALGPEQLVTVVAEHAQAGAEGLCRALVAAATVQALTDDLTVAVVRIAADGPGGLSS